MMSPYEIITVILQTNMVVISAIALVLNGIKKMIAEPCNFATIFKKLRISSHR